MHNKSGNGGVGWLLVCARYTGAEIASTLFNSWKVGGVCLCVFVNVFVHAFVFVFVCVFVYMCVYLCVHLCVWCVKDAVEPR